jgi:hypothetical protein
MELALNENDIYFKKYLKYKTKYLELKEAIGGKGKSGKAKGKSKRSNSKKNKNKNKKKKSEADDSDEVEEEIVEEPQEDIEGVEEGESEID